MARSSFIVALVAAAVVSEAIHLKAKDGDTTTPEEVKAQHDQKLRALADKAENAFNKLTHQELVTLVKQKDQEIHRKGKEIERTEDLITRRQGKLEKEKAQKTAKKFIANLAQSIAQGLPHMKSFLEDVCTSKGFDAGKKTDCKITGADFKAAFMKKLEPYQEQVLVSHLEATHVKCYLRIGEMKETQRQNMVKVVESLADYMVSTIDLDGDGFLNLDHMDQVCAKVEAETLEKPNSPVLNTAYEAVLFGCSSCSADITEFFSPDAYKRASAFRKNSHTCGETATIEGDIMKVESNTCKSFEGDARMVKALGDHVKDGSDVTSFVVEGWKKGMQQAIESSTKGLTE